MGPTLLLFLFWTICIDSQILPLRCNSLSQRCVGEGSPCTVDWDNTNCPNYAGSWSVCNKCADDTLKCHGGRCMKKTQGRYEQCDDSKHLFCQPEYYCSGGYCYELYPQDQPEDFAARGETCQTNADCVNNQCDPFINKCVNSAVDPTTGEAYCSGWYDCQWDEYCSPTDTTTTPNIPASCKKVPGGFGARSGAVCKAKSGASNWQNPTGQCGHAQFCMQKNQDESSDGHTPYTLSTCQKPYSIPEGEMCIPDIGANQISVGIGSNTYPISFCASGPCVLSGSPSRYRCSSADYTYAGTGCRTDDECGRGMTCTCPPGGGSRRRCMLDATYQQWEQGRRDWFAKTQPWLSCLDDNQCTYNDAQKGSCGNKHCSGFDKSNIRHTCSLEGDYPAINVPNYRGYHDTISMASTSSSVSLSVLFFTLMMAVGYALF